MPRLPAVYFPNARRFVAAVNLLKLRHLAEYLAVRVFVCIVQMLRLETCAALAKPLARLFTDVFPVRKAVIEENFGIAFPHWTAGQKHRCRLAMWEHLFLFIAEVAHAPRRIHITNYRQYIDFQNRDIFADVMFSKRGVVFVTAHFGVFEILGFNSGLTGFPTYSVARTLDNPYLEAFIGRFRGATGQHLIAKDGGSERLLEVLGQGGIVGVLADQHGGKKGCWIKFFGKDASAHKAIALLSLMNDVPLCVVSCRRTTGPLRFQQRVHAVFDPRTAPPEMQNVTAVTQWFTSEFEKFIAETPEQYWWLHKRWKDHRKKKAVAA
ncbi:MAG: lysophospholipid acyltransferase family protein [Planctomycetales bacterium]|nr:lysophospholipid acyltransferase family protein [Planctomycetales bacterium]MBN8624508.1 lysophospholipid acyltransferase family protein [Planctomycetota bacterium]